MRFIERLPDHGHYKVAIRDDDELARVQAEWERAHGSDESQKRPKVDARSWTPERAALTDVCDILLGIRASLEAQRTGKKQKADQMPRPLFAKDRLAENELYERHRDRVRMMLGR